MHPGFKIISWRKASVPFATLFETSALFVTIYGASTMQYRLPARPSFLEPRLRMASISVSVIGLEVLEGLIMALTSRIPWVLQSLGSVQLGSFCISRCSQYRKAFSLMSLKGTAIMVNLGGLAMGWKSSNMYLLETKSMSSRRGWLIMKCSRADAHFGSRCLS